MHPRRHVLGSLDLRSLRDLAREKAEQLDWGLLLALALGLFAASPFLLRAGLPRHTDAELHIYRAAELGHAIREGVLYPRWAPNLYRGYGYPIFHYYAPLTYYLSNAFALLLPGVGIVGGVKAVFVVGLSVASLGAYLLARELFDPGVALIAAAAFVLSPYVVFIDPHGRGVLAEHFAICLTPLTFYFLHQLMRSPSRGRLLGCVLSLGAVVLSHNLMGLVVSGLLAGYYIWRMAAAEDHRGWHWGPIAFVLAAALIAFFWLPALVESDAVKLDVIGPGHFDFREHFLSAGELLRPSLRIDWGATGPRFRHNLGLAQWLIAVPAFVAAIKDLRTTGTTSRGTNLAFFLVAGVALVALMMRWTTPVWELVPAMPYLQFPWRLLGPASLMLAICAAGGLTLVPHGVWRRRAITVGFLLLIVTALPLLNPAPWPSDFGGTEPADIIEWEKDSQALGTTSTGDFLPVTVQMIPPPMETLLRSYEDEGPVDKVNRATLPEGAQVDIVAQRPDYDRFRVTTPTSFVLRLYTFYFPGWRAYVNGERVEIDIAGPEGFITLEVPEGSHDVLVRFEDTVPRTLGWAVSAGGLVALVLTLVAWPCSQNDQTRSARRKFHPTTSVWLGGILLVVFAVKSLVLDPCGWLHHHSPPGQAIPAQHAMTAEFGAEIDGEFRDRIELIGYDLPRTQVRPGHTLPVVLYWRALTDIEGNYQSFVHVTRPLDVAWAQEDHLNPGGLPTSRWPSDKYVWDEYAIQLPQQLPPGTYRINVGLYSMAEGGRRLRLLSGTDQGEDSIIIGSIEVTGSEAQSGD